MRSIALFLTLSITGLVFAESPDAARSAAALESLKTELAADPALSPELAAKAFAKVPLTKADAAAARQLLWKAHVAFIKKDRAGEVMDKLIKDGKLELPYAFKSFGKKPAGGRSLWISLHGGGGAPKEVNDQQWNNQKGLYQLEEGLYLAPRAPTNTWNLWHESHIDRLFTRLIEDFIVFEDVDPDRVYVMGYSAGGDGVYQLAPRMADSFAAAAMMAGHPTTPRRSDFGTSPSPCKSAARMRPTAATRSPPSGAKSSTSFARPTRPATSTSSRFTRTRGTG